MKKFLSMLLATVLLVACLAFTGCSLFGAKPELDLETAAENLEDADYVVSFSDDEDELDINVEAQLEAYDEDHENYIYITTYKDSKSAKIAYQAIKLEKNYEKDSYNRRIDSYELEIKNIKNMLEKYEDELDDEDMLDYYEDMLEEAEDALEERKEEYAEEKENYVYGRKGNTIWIGTKDALEATKD